MATTSQFGDPHYADPPTALENDNSFSVRSPPGLARSDRNLRPLPTLLPPGSPRNWRLLRSSQPSRDGE
eukprot:7764543-Pyramimonas_sp.AAC.1